MPRIWPALLVEFSEPSSGAPESVPAEDLAAAALDSCEPVAVLELDSSWQACFSTVAARNAAAEVLASVGRGIRTTPFEVEDEDWARRSQADLGAVIVGRLVVAPPWAAAGQPDPLIIEPSMGFGSGHHASTRLCLALLQRLALDGRHVLDVGTGSGILAIAALRQGAGSVTGLDTDPDALESARANLVLNGMSGRVGLRQEDFRTSRLRGDVVLANLTAPALTTAAPALCAMVTRPGWLIVSGFLESDEAVVTAALRKALDGPVQHIQQAVEDGWVGLLVEIPGRTGDRNL